MKKNYFKLFFEKKIIIFHKIIIFSGSDRQNVKKKSIVITNFSFFCKKKKIQVRILKKYKNKNIYFFNQDFRSKIPKNITFLVWIRLFPMFFSTHKVSEPRQICFFTFRRIWQGKKSDFFRQNRPKLAIFQWNLPRKKI